MSLTLANLRAMITHALGGSSASIITSAAATMNHMVNEAGRRVSMAHPWKHLERPPTTLDLTISTAYIALPAEFSHLVAYEAAPSLGRCLNLTTYQGLAEMRARLITTTGAYFGAIVQPTQSSASTAQSVPRLEIWPTPSASVTAAFTVWYRAKWTELSGDTDVANVPLWFEPLLVQFVRAVAKGYEEEDIDDRIDRILGGGTFAQAIEHDGQIQPDYGPLEGGAVGMVRSNGGVPFDEIPDP